MSSLLDARASPNETLPPGLTRWNAIVFEDSCALREAVRVPRQKAPEDARVACVQLLMERRADIWRKDVQGLSPVDCLVRRAFSLGWRRHGYTRRMVEIMGPDAVAHYESQIGELRKSQGLLCISCSAFDTENDDVQGTVVDVPRPCADCCARSFAPAVRCPRCQMWTTQKNKHCEDCSKVCEDCAQVVPPERPACKRFQLPIQGS
jgi:hypothetical protein